MSSSGANSCGWSFLQALTKNSLYTKEQDTGNDKVCVNPHANRSYFRLSEESLRMCTESLCSETGSAFTESNIDEIAMLSVVTETGPWKQASKLDGFRVSKKLNHCRSFPPPLTSISGSNGVQVKPHREGGRLVLKAVTVRSSRGLFHAERGDGRLRLRLVQDEGFDELENEEVAQEEGLETGVVKKEAEQVSDDSDIDEQEEEEDLSGGVGNEMGMGKLPRPSRCMESGHGNIALLNWEPVWLAAYRLTV
ncbi:protein FANTASTIC FOUR 3-like [Juglans microcarpa x Juglans regia]|uniref:protein FANTASTIC FOUR 3-like n=1 Tax=Juglans microcarpa x Juglans regia TaxID=2249226 RepID=UPI001B7F7866|nr:protein FANTASTIC FOUR 3-like [Juglans microcarpa x Juglans regia]